MFLSRFFSIKFYNLGSGWIYYDKSWTTLNRYLYYNQQTIALFLINKSIHYLKKTFILFQTIISKLGSILFFSQNGYYFKGLEQKGFILREFKFSNITKGFFSNNLNSIKLLPDIVLTFDCSEYHSFLKELYSLNIPIVGSIEKWAVTNYIEYPLFLNSFSYYTYFFILNLYSKLVLLNKKL